MKKHIKNVHEVPNPEYISERENPENKLYLCQYCIYTNTEKAKIDEHTESNHQSAEGCEDTVDQNGSENDGNAEVYYEDESDGPEILRCTRCPYATRNQALIQRFFQLHWLLEARLSKE